MIEEIETVPVTGRRAAWDGTNLDEIRELAGDAVLGIVVNAVQIRVPDGTVHHVQPGWSVILLNDTPPEHALHISSSSASEGLFRVREHA